jgi:enolase
MKSAIRAVRAREVLDSRGQPTVECEVTLSDESLGVATVPSGTSTGHREAVELRDGDPGRYAGRGVQRAVANVNDVFAAAVRGLDARDQRALDDRLAAADGTPDRSRLGANALLAVSMAAARAAAASEHRLLYEHLSRTDQWRLPIPMINVINGGAHAANPLEFQEFMLVPHGAPSFREGIRLAAEVFHHLRHMLRSAGHITAVGEEGGYAPDLWTAEEALTVLVASIERAGYRPGVDVSLAIDVAANELREGNSYTFRKSRQPTCTSDEMIDLYSRLAARFPVRSIEDGLAEEDWDGWKRLTARLGSTVMIVGDDLFVTRADLIRRAAADHVANALLVKPNQVGTVSEALDAVAAAREAGYASVVSHRSGDTEDTFIADLAVASGAAFIKSGSLARSERVAKYNRLIRIEDRLGASGLYGPPVPVWAGRERSPGQAPPAD